MGKGGRGVDRGDGRDVEQYQAETERIRVVNRARMVNTVLEVLRWPLIIAASWLPAQPITQAFEDAAGETTSINVNVTVTITIALSVIAGAQRIRIHQQNAALKKLRDQIEELKGALEQASQQPTR